MVLLRKLGASLEGQASGLIHDVSHTAFSHLVDWVIGNKKKEDYQDINLQKIVSQSRIPKILKKHGMNPDKVTNIDQYSLLEMPAPDLCADRVDYALREFHMWASPEIVQQCIDDLVNHEEKIIFSSKDSAEKFGRTYGKCQIEHWDGIETMVRWELLSRALKGALKRRLIEPQDFYLEDEHLIKRLREKGNDEEKNILTILERKKLDLSYDETNPQFVLRKKFRYVDPLYMENGSLQRLSENDLGYEKFLKEQREINEKGAKVRLIA